MPVAQLMFFISPLFFSHSFLTETHKKVLGEQILPEQALIHYLLSMLFYVEIISAVPKGCLLSKI